MPLIKMVFARIKLTKVQKCENLNLPVTFDKFNSWNCIYFWDITCLLLQVFKYIHS